MGKHLDMFLVLVAIVSLGDAVSLFGQSQQQVQQGFPGLGGNLPGGLDGVLGGGPRGSLRSNSAPVLGTLGGSRGGGGDGGLADGILGGGFPRVLGNGRSSLSLGGVGGGSGTNTGSGGLGTPTSGSGGPPQGPASGLTGRLGAGLGGVEGSLLTPGGSSRAGYGLGGSSNGGLGLGRPGWPSMGVSGGPSGNTAGPSAFHRGSENGPDLRRPNQGTPTSGSGGPPQGPASGLTGLLGTGLGGVAGSLLTPGGSSRAGYGLGGSSNGGLGLGRLGGPSTGGSGGPSGNAAVPGAFGRGNDSGPDLSRPNEAFGPSLSSNGPLGPGGRGDSGVLGGSLPAPSLGSGPEPPLGGGEIRIGGSVSRPNGGVSGPEYRPPASRTGLFGTEGRGGPAGTGGSLSVPATVIGPATSLGGETRLPSPLPGIPGGHLGSVLPTGGSLSAGSWSGPGSASSMGTGAATSTGPGLPRAETRLRDGGLSGRRGPGIQKPSKKLDQAKAAAIGLGVAGGAFALSALAAGIARAIQHRPRSAGLVGARRSCPGCLPTPCVGNCGRKRRSIPTSKVPSEVLDNIPMNFERLY